ncbi:MAG: DUF3021 family protein [Lachnospiraceae bacterium]|nr:DUF3021 family protein [Lachnospiraceae bacterium]MBQ7780737.1 DUF3021 family protein [Lachnospiraceae bacterium]
MKKWMIRIGTSFAISAISGLVVNMIVELVMRIVVGVEDFPMVSQEFTGLFPSKTIAVEVNILLYGLIGASFSAATFIYEKDNIGFLVQNVLYMIMTACVWIPIVCMLWQLQKNMPAFISTLGGFVLTYAVMSFVGYQMTRKEVEDINRLLLMQD